MLQIISDLIEKKRTNITTDEDKKKLELIEKICKNEKCFFEMKAATSIAILKFLGIPENEVLDYYFKLISIEEFKKQMPKAYNLNDEEMLWR